MPYAVYDILVAYLFYNWRLYLLSLFTCFVPPPIPCLFSVSLSTFILSWFLDSTCKLDHSVCLSLTYFT